MVDPHVCRGRSATFKAKLFAGDGGVSISPVEISHTTPLPLELDFQTAIPLSPINKP